MELPKVKVANFEGPFDLLLHLIKKNEMDIYNVELYDITTQYLDYLNSMKEMDLEITSEFIVVAATLVEIKSKKLLPKAKIETEDEEDIEKKLMEKLIEYKIFKNATVFFKDKYIHSGEVYSKNAETIEEEKEPLDNSDIFKNITLLDLYQIFNKLLETYIDKQNVNNVIQRKIFVDKYKIEDKIAYLEEKFRLKEIIEFEEIIYESECKLEVIVTFLALLEMIKLKAIKVFQDDSFGSILIKRRNEDE